MNQPHLHPVLPWWRVRMVWLVIGGPALVVVASIATLVVAVRGGDKPLHETVAAPAGSLVPAAHARNHVVTPRR
ncbi:MAG TPA: hypothetical protein VJ743_07320 [Albitalea sp.]|nr:hypothetical protein [Albitalea sp.]